MHVYVRMLRVEFILNEAFYLLNQQKIDIILSNQNQLAYMKHLIKLKGYLRTVRSL